MQTRVPKFATNNTPLMSPTVSGAQILLSWCMTALTCAGLELRTDKSVAIVIVKGRSINTTPFSVSNP